MRITQRETEIVKLLATGLSNKEIASELEISVRTVHSHMQRILMKLKARNRVNAIALYMKSCNGDRQGILK